MYCLNSRCTNWTARDDFIHLFSETYREPQCRFPQGIIFMIIKTQTHYTIVYNQNGRQIPDSGEGVKFSCVQNIMDAHQTPTATVPVITGFGGAINDPFQIDPTGSSSNNTEAVTDLCTHTSRHTLLLILCFSWDQSLEIISVCVSLVFVWLMHSPREFSFSIPACLRFGRTQTWAQWPLDKLFPESTPQVTLLCSLLQWKTTRPSFKKTSHRDQSGYSG